MAVEKAEPTVGKLRCEKDAKWCSLYLPQLDGREWIFYSFFSD
ncbi:hypothetical protein Lalb_Chr11g0069611 [Lupinus albus]|uniref:Uncharacterized protein n=1 Tax=Lupinus albus TaxID=3870 RepID=A0A6A4PS93_LUPAL|nr:hypothetical protein Lalb_Chr11g0069611 [Lupinus albus]